MPSAAMGIELISEPFLIPIWFYVYSALAYAVSALISVFVAYFSYKFFKLAKSKSSAMLLLGFLFMTIAYSALAFTSVYTYFYKPYFNENFDLGSLSLVNSVGFNLYYITSIVAYVALLAMYLPGDIKKLFEKFKVKTKLPAVFPVAYVPLWYLNLVDFHIISILILLYVAVRNVINFCKKKDANNFLVMLAFVLMLSFHASLLLTEFDPTIYIAANTLLAAGFGSLLIMLIRVSRVDRKRIERKNHREDRKNTRKKV